MKKRVLYDVKEAQRLFLRYAEKHRKALRSLDIDDGVAAGKAWGEFLAEFERDVAFVERASR